MFLTKFNHVAVAKSMNGSRLRRDNPLALTGLARSPSPRRQSHLHPNFFCHRLYRHIDLPCFSLACGIRFLLLFLQEV